MMSLAVVTDCEGCGACCVKQGSPPGFALFFPPEHVSLHEVRALFGFSPEDDPDWPIFKALPDDLKASLREYYLSIRKEPKGDRSYKGMPCLWFDTETKKCLHYEHRPTVCRDFPVGQDDCLSWRQSEGIKS